MPRISQSRIAQFFTTGDAAQTNTDKGKALEDLICYMFSKIPGISVTKRNTLSQFQSEEIDVAFWNRPSPEGFYFLPHIILVECKNWSRALGSEEVSWFDSKLRRRAQRFGILVAANGITGNASDKNAAHDIVGTALAEGRQLVALTRSEIEGFKHTNQIVELVQGKLCELAVAGTLFL